MHTQCRTINHALGYLNIHEKFSLRYQDKHANQRSQWSLILPNINQYVFTIILIVKLSVVRTKISNTQ